MKIPFLNAPLLGAAFALLAPLASAQLVLAPDSSKVYLGAEASASGDGLRSDPGTIGAFFATNSRPYNPIITLELPKGWEGAQVWVRQRGGPFRLKGNGGTSDLRWFWDIPAVWQWADYGYHTREALSDKFLIIRSDTLPPDAGIDAVVLLREETQPKPAELDLLAKQEAAVAAKK